MGAGRGLRPPRSSVRLVEVELIVLRHPGKPLLRRFLIRVQRGQYFGGTVRPRVELQTHAAINDKGRSGDEGCFFGPKVDG